MCHAQACPGHQCRCDHFRQEECCGVGGRWSLQRRRLLCPGKMRHGPFHNYSRAVSIPKVLRTKYNTATKRRRTMLDKKNRYIWKKNDTVLYCLTFTSAHINETSSSIRVGMQCQSSISNRSVHRGTEAQSLHMPVARGASMGWWMRPVLGERRGAPKGRLCAWLMPLVISCRVAANANSPAQRFSFCHIRSAWGYNQYTALLTPLQKTTPQWKTQNQ